MLQLREKHLSDRSLLRAGRDIRSVTKGSKTKFIINDRPDLAVLMEADGLHLGQDDMPLELARKIVGPDMLIGLSTHSIEQAKQALTSKPDYIGFGPVFTTPTKQIPDPVVGTRHIREVTEMSELPVVAIGGIDEHNVDEVLNAGAKYICMVRYLMEVPDLANRIGKIKKIIHLYTQQS